VTLTPADRALLAEARRATLATIDPRGRARLVPICFVVDGDVLWSPLDEKPKAVADVRTLARVRDITERPEVTVLVDRWSEDWDQLAWLRVHGRAALVEPDDVTTGILASLRARYPQYEDHALEHRPMLTVRIETATRWRARGDDG
jgi:PPOX class probable F420-dependent enzyme